MRDDERLNNLGICTATAGVVTTCLADPDDEGFEPCFAAYSNSLHVLRHGPQYGYHPLMICVDVSLSQFRVDDVPVRFVDIGVACIMLDDYRMALKGVSAP